MLLKLALKNVISRRSSLVIILFITFAVSLFCLANAVFDSTEQGVQTNYVASFTGDFIIRPKSKFQQSLFGDETPVTGELTTLSTIVPYEKIIETIEAMPEVAGTTGQISGAAMAERSDGANRVPAYVFGVEGEPYLSLMKSIHLLRGKPYEHGQRGVMLCSQMAEKLGVDVGSTVQFIVSDGPNYKIRAADVTAVFEYEIYNEIFGRFVIADPITIRSLLGITEVFSSDSYNLSEEATNLFTENNDFSDFDDLFDDVSDYDEALIQTDSSEEEEIVTETTSEDLSESTSWNYLIVRLKDAKDTKRIMKKISRIFRKNGWPVQVADWRHAAGSTALYLFWMRKIFNIGIVIVLAAGFIIVNNTLVINILDRTREIGTLRAIGAKKRFISLQCMTENLILTITSGILGVLAGNIGTHFINKAHIVLHNSFLVQLFGAEAISVHVSSGNVIKLFILVLALALLGWIYPVINALKVSPVDAISGAK
ncbi:ABC transporter permease [Treponema bryantii]|uniref:ABC transporter permease n=1 Tax=Treponema bryantii TaxID=163 RepID=UPI0003B615FF|nr:FtsX-like permease family protein [Treponema bryantii]